MPQSSGVSRCLRAVVFLVASEQWCFWLPQSSGLSGFLRAVVCQGSSEQLYFQIFPKTVVFPQNSGISSKTVVFPQNGDFPQNGGPGTGAVVAVVHRQ